MHQARCLVVTMFALVLHAALSNQAIGDELYVQNPNGTDGERSSVYSSTRLADSFSFDVPTEIDAVRWYGGYFYGSGGSEFDITIYEDGGGRPSTYTGTVWSLGSVSEFWTGASFSYSLWDIDEYEYYATLSPPFVAQPCETYWLEVEEQGWSDWLWESGSGGDGTSRFDEYASGSWSTVLPFDLSFILYGQFGCLGDLDDDGVVGLSDLAELLGHYGTSSGATYPDGDLDCDGDVDLSDLATLLGHYGDTCN